MCLLAVETSDQGTLAELVEGMPSYRMHTDGFYAIVKFWVNRSVINSDVHTDG